MTPRSRSVAAGSSTCGSTTTTSVAGTCWPSPPSWCGSAKAIYIVNPPAGAADGWDIADAGDGEDATELFLALGKAAERFEPAPPRPLIGKTYAEYVEAADQPIEWAIEGAAIKESLTAMLGKPEGFKSTGMQQLFVCATTDRPWLGLDVIPSAAVYISNEKTRQTVAHRLRSMAGGAVIDPGRLRIIHREGVVIGERHWDEVREAIAEIRDAHVFVGLDTLSSLAPGNFNENKSEHMGPIIDALSGLITEFRATVLLAAHPSKDPTNQTTVRGHGSLDGVIDGTMEFTRSERSEPSGSILLRPKDGEARRLDVIYDVPTLSLVVAPDIIVKPGRDTVAEQKTKDLRMLSAISSRRGHRRGAEGSAEGDLDVGCYGPRTAPPRGR